MKTRRIIALTSFLLVASFLAVWASDKKEDAKESVKAKVTEKSEATTTVTLKNQTHCPVMGGVIDSTVFTDIQGQRVYHCCPGCSDELINNPDKFFKKASSDGILFENIQKSCPVSAMELNDSVFTDYVGRRIYFGSEECRDTFLKEPVKYISKLMDAPKIDKKATSEKSMDGMSGHKHKKSDG